MVDPEVLKDLKDRVWEVVETEEDGLGALDRFARAVAICEEKLGDGGQEYAVFALYDRVIRSFSALANAWAAESQTAAEKTPKDDDSSLGNIMVPTKSTNTIVERPPIVSGKGRSRKRRIRTTLVTNSGATHPSVSGGDGKPSFPSLGVSNAASGVGGGDVEEKEEFGFDARAHSPKRERWGQNLSVVDPMTRAMGAGVLVPKREVVGLASPPSTKGKEDEEEEEGRRRRGIDVSPRRLLFGGEEVEEGKVVGEELGEEEKGKVVRWGEVVGVAVEKGYVLGVGVEEEGGVLRRRVGRGRSRLGALEFCGLLMRFPVGLRCEGYLLSSGRVAAVFGVTLMECLEPWSLLIAPSVSAMIGSHPVVAAVSPGLSSRARAAGLGGMRSPETAEVEDTARGDDAVSSCGATSRLFETSRDSRHSFRSRTLAPVFSRRQRALDLYRSLARAAASDGAVLTEEQAKQVVDTAGAGNAAWLAGVVAADCAALASAEAAEESDRMVRNLVPDSQRLERLSRRMHAWRAVADDDVLPGAARRLCAGLEEFLWRFLVLADSAALSSAVQGLATSLVLHHDDASISSELGIPPMRSLFGRVATRAALARLAAVARAAAHWRLAPLVTLHDDHSSSSTQQEPASISACDQARISAAALPSPIDPVRLLYTAWRNQTLATVVPWIAEHIRVTTTDPAERFSTRLVHTHAIATHLHRSLCAALDQNTLHPTPSRTLAMIALERLLDDLAYLKPSQTLEESALGVASSELFLGGASSELFLGGASSESFLGVASSELFLGGTSSESFLGGASSELSTTTSKQSSSTTSKQSSATTTKHSSTTTSKQPSSSKSPSPPSEKPLPGAESDEATDVIGSRFAGFVAGDAVSKVLAALRHSSSLPSSRPAAPDSVASTARAWNLGLPIALPPPLPKRAAIRRKIRPVAPNPISPKLALQDRAFTSKLDRAFLAKRPTLDSLVNAVAAASADVAIQATLPSAVAAATAKAIDQFRTQFRSRAHTPDSARSDANALWTFAVASAENSTATTLRRQAQTVAKTNAANAVRAALALDASTAQSAIANAAANIAARLADERVRELAASVGFAKANAAMDATRRAQIREAISELAPQI